MNVQVSIRADHPPKPQVEASNVVGGASASVDGSESMTLPMGAASLSVVQCAQNGPSVSDRTWKLAPFKENGIDFQQLVPMVRLNCFQLRAHVGPSEVQNVTVQAFVVQKFQDGLMILRPDAGFLQPNPTMLRVGGEIVVQCRTNRRHRLGTDAKVFQVTYEVQNGPDVIPHEAHTLPIKFTSRTKLVEVKRADKRLLHPAVFLQSHFQPNAWLQSVGSKQSADIRVLNEDAAIVRFCDVRDCGSYLSEHVAELRKYGYESCLLTWSVVRRTFIAMEDPGAGAEDEDDGDSDEDTGASASEVSWRRWTSAVPHASVPTVMTPASHTSLPTPVLPMTAAIPMTPATPATPMKTPHQMMVTGSPSRGDKRKLYESPPFPDAGSPIKQHVPITPLMQQRRQLVAPPPPPKKQHVRMTLPGGCKPTASKTLFPGVAAPPPPMAAPAPVSVPAPAATTSPNQSAATPQITMHIGGVDVTVCSQDVGRLMLFVQHVALTWPHMTTCPAPSAHAADDIPYQDAANTTGPAFGICRSPAKIQRTSWKGATMPLNHRILVEDDGDVDQFSDDLEEQEP